MNQKNQQDQEHQDLRNSLIKINYILDGLETYEPFKKFLEYFEEQSKVADTSWQSCLVETDDGLKHFYSLRAHKLSLINILNRLDELRFEKEDLQEELKEEEPTQSE